MSPLKRAAFLALSIVILVAAFVVLRPSDDPEPPQTSTTPTQIATPTPTHVSGDDASEPPPTASSTPTTPRPTPDPGPLLTTAQVRKIRVTKGDTVRFRARSSAAEEIHVHGYDLARDVEPGKTARMTFKATIEGIFEIEFEHAGTPIAELRVDP